MPAKRCNLVAMSRPTISRRRLLRWGVVGAPLLAAGVLLWRPGSGARGRPPGVEPLEVFDDTEAAILAAVVARMLEPGDTPGAAAPDVAHSVAFVDRFVAGQHEAVAGEVRALIGAFERVSPLAIGRLRRFTELEPASQDRVLGAWQRGPLPLRAAFTALKQLAYMSHYGRDVTWSGIGYGGPIVRRPSRWAPGGIR